MPFDGRRTQCGNIGPIGRVNLIARVESHQPFGRDAVHGPAVHGALPCEGLGGIAVLSPRRTVTAAAAFVEHDHVEVNLAPSGIPKNEIPGASIRTRNWCVSATLESSGDQR